jgi:uncharacterized repeat protein (TIGR03803 family)
MYPSSVLARGISQPFSSFRTLSRSLTLALSLLVLIAFTATYSPAQTYTALYDFGTKATDPESPQYSGIITQGRDGNLYSTARSTPLGACSYCGAAFSISPAGVLTVYDFTPTGMGYTPLSGVSLGIDGNFYGTTESGGTFNRGTIFRVTSSGTLATLYNFGTCQYPCIDGFIPNSPPMQGADGNFYGTTPHSGDGTNDGIAYQITSTGKYKILHVFSLSSGGYNPDAPFIQGTDGSFYGTTTVGGKSLSSTCVAAFSSFSCGTVFKMTATGHVTFLHEFVQTDGAGPIGPVTQGSDGNFYGTTSEGGTSKLGVVFKMTSKGVLTVLHNFAGSDGQNPDGGLVQASDGNFYGTTSGGGTLGHGTIFKVTLAGAFSVIHNFDSTNGATPEVTMVQHTNGILYGDTDNGDAEGGGVFYSLDVGAPPFIRLQTTSGKVGSTVSILGQGFTGATAVSFGGVNATSFTVSSDTYLTAKVPVGAKTGTVTVVRPSGSLVSINQQFKVIPTISSIAPTSGPIGTVVTINGTGLTQTTKVSFGTVNASTFTVNSDSKVSVTVPTGAQTGKIKVTTLGGLASSPIFTVTP